LLYDFMYRAVHAMHTITYTEVRSRLSETMTQVCEDHHPIIITKKSDMAVVMMSLSDYEALEETSYLLRSPKNALSGYWSRRINTEHRIVYKALKNQIFIAQLRYHYRLKKGGITPFN